MALGSRPREELRRERHGRGDHQDGGRAEDGGAAAEEPGQAHGRGAQAGRPGATQRSRYMS